MSNGNGQLSIIIANTLCWLLIFSLTIVIALIIVPLVFGVFSRRDRFVPARCSG